MTRYLITGATGLLGSNFIWEILKQHVNSIEEVEIFILGRPKFDLTLKERIKKSLIQEGQYYIYGEKVQIEKLKDLLKRIKCFHYDLKSTCFDSVTQNNLDSVNSFDHFFHIAALTDFRNSPDVINNLTAINYTGTRNILECIKTLDIKQFHYISTAYVCGDNYGEIQSDFLPNLKSFRNPYEKSKFDSEKYFIDFCTINSKSYKVYRPSTLAGRLIEKPIGYTNKFDVFYGWSAFWLQLRLKAGYPIDDFSKSLELTVRICLNSNSGLNIISVDNAVKSIYHISNSSVKDVSFHVVSSENLSHEKYVSCVLRKMNIVGYKFVDNIPETFNNGVEALYYKTVGSIYTPYVIHKPIYFKNQNVMDLYNRRDLHLPRLNLSDFEVLLDFAKRANFGISL